MVFDVWKSIKKGQFSSIYLLYGSEAYFINETKQLLINHVLNESELDFNLSELDLEEITIEEALEDVETLPFLGEKRLVFMKNPVFLSSEKTKAKVEHNVKKLEEYIANPAPYSILVLTASYEKLDQRKKITKELLRKATVVEAKKLNEMEMRSWIQKRITARNFMIEDQALDRLLELAGTNLMMVMNEVDKIMLYAEGTNSIDVQLVDKLVAKSFEQNIFTLMDGLLQRKIDTAITIYHELIRQNEEPIKILSVMAGQVRLLYQVKELSRQGYSQQKIATLLKVHPFRVKLAQEKAGMFDEEELVSLLKEFAEVDYKMKTGQADKAIMLELLFLKMQ